MVWKLSDLCLQCVEWHVARYPDLASSLPTVYKEILIERLACHDRFHPHLVPHISASLFSSSLRHVQLMGCDQITDSCLQLLGQSGCRLEVLVMSRLMNITDIGVHAVTRDQNALLVLHLQFLPEVTQQVLCHIAAPRLWCVRLRHTLSTSRSWCTPTTLATFLSQNPSIKVLDIDTDVENIPVVARCLGASLEELQTCFQSATDEIIDSLSQCCPNLKKLDLNGAKSVGKESLIKLFQACTQMTDLDLGYCSRIATFTECQVLWTLPTSLTCLSLCGLLLRDEEILVESVTRLPHLASIKLCGVPALSDHSLTKIVEKIGDRLAELNVSGIGSHEITDEGLKSVAKHCTALRSLHISLLRQVTGVTLLPLLMDSQRAARIQKLSFNSKLMDATTLEQVMLSCPNLLKLDLSGLYIVTDAMIINLAEHSPQLSKLNLKGCRQVTDAAICHLSGCCCLTSLCLSGLHALTDKSMFSLASSCPLLKEIYLNGCANVSPVAVQYLKDCCLQGLFAEHNIPNASPNQLMAKNLDTGEFCRADLLSFR